MTMADKFYFNVKRNMKIGRKLHIPAVSYVLPSLWRATIEKLQAEGKAVITDHVVTFQNGRALHEADRKAEVSVFKAEKKFARPVKK